MIKDIETNLDCKEFVSEAEALKEFGLDWNDNLVGFRQTLSYNIWQKHYRNDKIL